MPFNLKLKIQERVNPKDPHKTINFFKNHKLSEFVKIGDVVYIEAAANQINDGFVVAKDENKITMAQFILVSRFEGMNELNSIFDQS